MPESHFERLSALFGEALGLGGEARDALVTRAREEDSRLGEELAAMLSAHTRADGFLDPAAGPAAGQTEPEPLSYQFEGAVVAGFTVVRLIAAGGMGAVYEAEQDRPHRRVALKILHPHLTSPELLKRFEREAEILGRLSHAGIARIFAAGSHTTPAGVTLAYIAMELIEGSSLTAHVRASELSIRDRVRLLIEVCESVEYAHQKGVIHRDLKPSNVLVDQAGRPQVLDFGVAHATQSDLNLTTLVTNPGVLLGTLAYMSPEQARGDGGTVDTRADVHALGVLLFELLSGQLPYNLRDQPLFEAVRILRDDDPTTLAVHAPACSGDLDTIVTKALEKEPARRFASAAELGADLRRFLDDIPIHARPVSKLYLLAKFTRRNRLLVGSVCAVLLALSIGLIVALNARQDAEDEAARAQKLNRFLIDAIASEDPIPRPVVYTEGASRDQGTERREFLSAIVAGLDEFEQDPRAEASLQLAVGQALKGRARPDEALVALRRAWELREFLSPTQRARGGGMLAQLLRYAGFVAEARALIVEVRGQARRELPQGSLELVTIEFINLTVGLEELGDEERLTRTRDLIVDQAEALGPYPGLRDAIRTLQIELLRSLGRVDEAIELAEGIIERAATEGTESGDSCGARQTLAKIYAGMEGRSEDALRYAEESVQASVEAFGPGTRQAVWARVLFAKDLRLDGQLERAEVMLSTAVQDFEPLFIEEARTLCMAQWWHGLTLRDLGRDAEAADRFARCVPFLSGPNGVEIEPGGPQLRSDILRDTWRALHDAGREDEAVELLEAASWRFTETPFRTFWAGKVNGIAWETKDGGPRALAVAEDLARWAYEVCTEEYEPDAFERFNAADTLGVILMMRAELDESEALLREALDSARRVRGDEDPLTAEYRLHLGQCLSARGDSAGARAELTEALRVLESQPESPDLAAVARAALGLLAR